MPTNRPSTEARIKIDTIKRKAYEVRDSIDQLKSDVSDIPSWCKTDTVNPLISKFLESVKEIDEMIKSLNALTDIADKYISDVISIDEHAREMVELMNSQSFKS